MFEISGEFDLENLKEKVLRFTRAETYRRIGENLVYRLSSYIADGSNSRHKWAEKLGAEPTGMLEFNPSRVVSTTKAGGKISSDNDESSASLVIEGVEGIGRAFHDLDIYPKDASALTVPIHKEAYAKTVADLKGEGWHIFRRGRVLVGNHGQTIGGRAVPLFVLCGHVHVSQDRELLPSSSLIYHWAISEAEREIKDVDLG